MQLVVVTVFALGLVLRSDANAGHEYDGYRVYVLLHGRMDILTWIKCIDTILSRRVT